MHNDKFQIVYITYELRQKNLNYNVFYAKEVKWFIEKILDLSENKAEMTDKFLNKQMSSRVTMGVKKSWYCQT